MADLTDTAFRTRQLVKYGSVVLVILIILRIGFSIVKQWWQTSHPPPPLPASVSFGKLSKLPFPQQDKPSFNFRLETVSGSTGEFDQLGNVYLVPVKSANLLALDRTKELARKMGFLFEPKAITETLYEWTKDEPIPATVRIDTITEHFSFEADWRVRPDLLSQARAPSEAESISIARNWLSSLRKLETDLAAGEAQVSYLKISGTEIVPALSQSDAQFVRVNLIRAPIEEMKVWPVDPKQGIVSITFIPSSTRSIRGNLQVIEARYKYNSVSYEQNATYKLINAKTAWEQLVKGHGYYASFVPGVKDIAIRRMSLGYFDPPEAGFFLQPIFIFEGDNFVAYLTAIDPSWIE